MKRAAACIAVCLACAGAQAQGVAPIQARLDGMFQPWSRGNVPGCAAGITRNGQWIARGGYGAANLEHRARITTDTVFYTASVSKQFTAAALLRLADQGKVALDDDVRKYIAEIPERLPAVTLRHLLHHTSGFEDYLRVLIEARTLQDKHTKEEILRLVANRPPLFPAGQTHAYSNTNYFLIAEVVARASGKSLRAFAQDELFAPLGMKNTRFYDDASEVVPHYAAGYWREKDGYHVVKTLYEQVGGGGLLTTVNDLGKWVRIFDDPDALAGSPGLGARMQERGRLSDGTVLDYAFGLAIGKEQGTPVATHNGAFLGYRAEFGWVPDKRTAVFVLCNFAEAPTTSMMHNLYREVLR